MKTLSITRMAKFRLLRQFTQLELARKIGKSRSLIALIERGELAPSRATATAIARAIGLKSEELFPGVEARDE